MPETEIRPARPEDREAVFAFCEQTWEWGDYIEYVWDEWLHDSKGILFVATIDGKSVAVSHLQMLNETDAWLEGMRVDPAYRQHGLAKALDDVMLAEAMRRGATNVRLITESANTIAISLIERGFFRKIGSFALFRAKAETVPEKRQYGLDTPQLATQADIDDIINYLNTSNIFPAIGGLYYHRFTAYRITGDLLEAKLRAQQVYILRRWNRLDGLAIAEPQEGRYGSQLSIGYIDGTTESIILIAYALRRQLTDIGIESINAYVPDLIMVRDAFVGAGYEWDNKIFYTYERGLI
ncbi:MAG: GNAT family N-acetyltransferase [Chloroflexota bacterium]|nr:MAG: GNAT family N-acetyltransferase [Chloroflexota bacterium]